MILTFAPDPNGGSPESLQLEGNCFSMQLHFVDVNAVQVTMTPLQDRTQVLFQDTHLVLKGTKQLLDITHQFVVDQILQGHNTLSSGGHTKSSSTTATKSTPTNTTSNVGQYKHLYSFYYDHNFVYYSFLFVVFKKTSRES